VTAIKHPALAQVNEERRATPSLRIADSITGFAGSMNFVYLHSALFALWIVILGFVLGIDKYPFNFLTMTVSLEAIFLSTFVMIGQNRQADMNTAKAEHDFAEEQSELKLNTDLTKAIHELTAEIHTHLGVGKTKPEP
jgi:uncharacterized membrane protein